jgi:CRISPR system Cascade subunit CasC
MSTDPNFLTVHTLTSLPFHNRNRDDRGQPKQLREGGKIRSYMSSQSRKRSMRVGYERFATDFDGLNGSVRSKTIAEAGLERAVEIAAERGIADFDRRDALRRARETVKSLTTSAGKTATKAETAAEKRRELYERKIAGSDSYEQLLADFDEKAAALKAKAEATGEAVDDSTGDTAVWVTDQEIENLATALVNSTSDIQSNSVFDSVTSSLANSAFGRMMAANPGLSIEAAVAVTPAVTTHAIQVNIDYFTAVDDRRAKGAAHLDQASYTSGVYYASSTFDRRQLRNTWSGFGSADTDELLGEFVRHVVLDLPQGKKNATAADTFPSVIIAEQQRARTGYQFQTPVEADANGGFLKPSQDEIYRQANRARAFDPRHFGKTVVSGTEAFEFPSQIAGAEVANMEDLTAFIVEWLKA